ncbi:MAG: hypothetical protein MZW92_36060 [Comamonadaceae bacterium]|nr:hypothetical protein [Comamonadaceae bacterium]
MNPTDIGAPRLLPQGRRLPVGLPGPHPRSRIHPADRRRAATATPTWSTGRRTSSRASSAAPATGPASRPAGAAASRRTRARAGAGGDLPPEARRRRLQGRHPRAPAAAGRGEATASAWPASAPGRRR